MSLVFLPQLVFLQFIREKKMFLFFGCNHRFWCQTTIHRVQKWLVCKNGYVLTKFRLQCRQTYFRANETRINQALTIVFVQKFYRKILDFCIFEKLSKFFIYLPQNRSFKSSLFSVFLDSQRGVLCEIGVSHCFYKIAKHPPL